METDKGHVHILLRYSLKDSIAGIVHMLKRHMTFRMWKKYPDKLSKEYWKNKYSGVE